ncbi:hypothetical protein TcCL_Unassigned03931 [Trypanosoma cruzi]|nr:hypothetical protein TcCL_Unassigned03931 [Trypanosoma cruzi]
MTQTLRGQCPVSCAESARRFWARHCATRRVPSERNSRHVLFRSHSWRWWHPLPRCVLLASTTMLRCDRGCPARAVLGWVDSALRGETPSATLDRCAHATPSTPLPPFGNHTAAGTLSPKQHTRENVAAYSPREQSDCHTLRPSCRQVCPRTTLFWGHTHTTQGSPTATQKKKKKERATHVKGQKNTQQRCRTDKEEKRRPIRLEMARQPTRRLKKQKKKVKKTEIKTQKTVPLKKFFTLTKNKKIETKKKDSLKQFPHP